MTPEGGSLLVVDDDPAARAELRFYLTQHGFAIRDAEDGPQALDLLNRERFDLVLLDVEMPGLGGLEVLRAVRDSHPAADLPVMMATAKDRTSDIVEALRLGATDYVTKPFNLPVVLARVRTQQSLKRAIDRARQLEQSLAQRNAELEQANRRMSKELEAAVCVQKALIPSEPPPVGGVEFAWRYQPCVELAGDLLGLVGLGPGRACLYVLDVVDKGTKAALLAAMIHRVLARLLAAAEAPTPAEIAAQLNREFPFDLRTQQFFTLMVGMLDRHAGEFRFVSAGHPGPIHVRPSGEATVVRVPGVPIGLGDGEYEEQRLGLDMGDRLYLYSDGLTEAMNPLRQQFTEARCAGVLAGARDRGLAEGLARLEEAVRGWTAPHLPHDDISLVGVELT